MRGVVVLITLVLIGGLVFYFFPGSSESPQENLETKETNMKLTSPAFENNQSIPSKYTCDGEDINPPLQISGAPEGTKSLVLIVDDPDAPLGIWDHWLVWNISSSTPGIEENSLPEGSVQGMNSFGKQPYGGPCPPSGTHHYHFKLYALNTELSLDPSSKKEDLEEAMKGAILAQTELIGLYQR